MARGNIDFDQIQDAVRKGPGSQFQMFGGGATALNAPLLYDADGNAVAGLVRGNTNRVQMAGGTFNLGHAGIYDASGNLVDAGAAPALVGSGAVIAGDLAVWDSTGKLMDGGQPGAGGAGGGKGILYGKGVPFAINSVGPHNMVANSLPTPYVAFASDVFLTDEPWQAFDGIILQGNQQHGWYGNLGSGVSLGLDFGALTGPLCGYGIVSWHGDTTTTPTDWTLQGSPDNSAWDILDTQTGQSIWGEAEAKYLFRCTTAYRYYRLVITATQGQPIAVVNEFYFYAAASPIAGALDGQTYIDTIGRGVYGPLVGGVGPLVGYLVAP